MSIDHDQRNKGGQVRHVRIRVLAISAFALLAAMALGAVPAGAAELTAKQKAVFRDCPVGNAELDKLNTEYQETGEKEGEGVLCFAGITAGGKEGGSFTVGGVKTALNKKITLHGAMSFSEPTAPGEGKIWPAEDGKTLEAPPLKVTKGIKLVTPQIQEEAGWPQALKDIYNDKVAKKETGLSATIEVAGGNLMFENRNGINPGAIVTEEGNAFTLPLKVKLSGPLLYKLQKGADTCSIGNDENPVVQHLTTGLSEAPFPYEANSAKGSVGGIRTNKNGTVLELFNSTLVDSTWPVDIPAVDCGGEYESYVNDAISKVLSLPAPAGASTTILKGTLYTGEWSTVKKEI